MRLEYNKCFAGHHIQHVAAEAIALAVDKKMRLAVAAQVSGVRPEPVEVHFEFNGVDVIVNADSTPDQVQDFLHAELDRKRAEYAASPEGIAAAKRSEEERVATQKKLDSLVAQFGTRTTMMDLMLWVKEYAEAADRIGVNAYLPVVIAGLKTRGIIRNMWVGDAEVKANSNKQKSAQYILGQVLDMAERGMPPHPIAGEFAKRWLEHDGNLSYREVPLPPK